MRPPLTGPTIGAFKTLAKPSNTGTLLGAGKTSERPSLGAGKTSERPSLGAGKTSERPTWVDHTSDRLIKGSGRSCLPGGDWTGCHPLFVFNWSWLIAGSPDADQVSLSFHRHLIQDR